MLKRLKELFSQGPDEAVRAPGPERVQLATCVLLMEVAQADEEFCDAERERIAVTLEAHFDLSQSAAAELMRLARDERDAAFDLWHFTHTINESCTPTEKRRIVEEFWRVIYADGTLDAHEDYLVHKLARLLNLNHPQLIEAKRRAKSGD